MYPQTIHTFLAAMQQSFQKKTIRGVAMILQRPKKYYGAAFAAAPRASALAGPAIGLVKNEIVQISHNCMRGFHGLCSFLKNYWIVYEKAAKNCADFCLTIKIFFGRIQKLSIPCRP